MRTAGAQCDNNSVDAEALLRLTLLTLRQQINQFGQLNQIRSLFEERAKAENSDQTTSIRDREIGGLTHTVAQLQADRQAIGRRMACERDDERYQFMATEFNRITRELRSAELQLAQLKNAITPAATASTQVDAAMELLAKINRVTTDPRARTECTSLRTVETLDWTGFHYTIKGNERKVRRLPGGIIAFGDENLPIPLHGSERVTSEDNADEKSTALRASSEPDRT